MKKLLLIIVILLILSSLVFAKLSDDTLKEVERLRFKHLFNGIDITELISIGHSDISTNDGIEWT